MTPNEFIALIASGAQESMRATKVPASFTIAQAALESSWGARAPGMNLFGIKANPSWKGAITEFSTHEVVDGKSVPTIAKFRAYSSWADGLTDHAKFLTSNKRYAPAFLHVDNAEAFTLAVAAAGYATDPQYAAKIIAVMRSHNLTQFDKAVA